MTEGEEVGTGTLVVDEKDTYINTSILTDVPEGYVIAIIGDLPIEDNTVVVTVRAEKRRSGKARLRPPIQKTISYCQTQKSQLLLDWKPGIRIDPENPTCY